MHKNTIEKRPEQIEMYVITAYSVFYLCFKNADLLNPKGELIKEKFAPKLKQKLIENYGNEYNDDTVFWNGYQDYIRDTYDDLAKAMEDGNPQIRIRRFNEYKFTPILKYADKLDYVKFNDSFNNNDQADKKTDDSETLSKTDKAQKDTPINILAPSTQPISISALYSPKNYGRIDLIRNPYVGNIYLYNNGDLVFEGDIDLHIRHSLIERATPHTMYRDKNQWVKVDYQKDGERRTAYFSGSEYIVGQDIFPDIQKILSCLNKQND
ncbi:hypothetical protein [Mucilaginibacter paludis]|uniref:Uncharacterized protein n=1 Tax=Mucilaginibacter paludis DSM 18603 TaxID=714943 RepID=H1YC03_9SPHI|nr:hypothetical protein [Mucilaginibacter paludis]EHQ27081.1 hypothetical protein Mucpa_2973 [Mucilaginibacter paludis DSM 18603]